MSATATADNTKRIQILADALYRAIRNPAPSRGEPMIVENRIAQTKSAHVTVVWDRWDDIPPEGRSKVILDAYARAGRLADLTITAAMGLTGEQALRIGFLPYSIIPTRRARDKASPQELESAMAAVGGLELKIGSSTQLRFPTLEKAEDAYRELSQKIPGPYWAIVHEQPAND
jgi:hypothetical protein